MRQAVFFIDSSDKYNLDEYIISESNKIAVSVLINWPDNFGVLPYKKTLILQGDKSSGKTFLAKKWANISSALFLDSSEAVTIDMLKDHDAFIVDNFDISWDEEILLHNFNIIHENNKYLLITLEKIPDIKLQDLASRIKSCNMIKIGKIDDELMKMLIFKLFSNYSVKVSVDVIEYLLKILPREFLSIIDSVKKINMFALESKRKVTIPLVKNVLNAN